MQSRCELVYYAMCVNFDVILAGWLIVNYNFIVGSFAVGFASDQTFNGKIHQMISQKCEIAQLLFLAL